MNNELPNKKLEPVEQLDFLADNNLDKAEEKVPELKTEKNTTEEEKIHCQYCEDTNPNCMYCRGRWV